MIYKDFKGMKLSDLGLGAMRLPVIEGKDAKIDEAATAEMVEYAMNHGVNYFDTAWGYHGGQSEIIMGNILGQYPRDSYFLASKFPGYDLSNMDKVKNIFEAQLKKCRVDYFDFYMLHNVCEMNIDAYLDERYEIVKYLLEQKEAGRIRHLGFSAHGSYEVMKRFLEAYSGHMEFCQIQINYLDWSFQNAKGKVELLNGYGIPVWAMEPLRGGKLASLSQENLSRLNIMRKDESAAAWAFRFLQAVPEVIVTLSGMSNLEQLKENIGTYETDHPLNTKEQNILFDIAESMIRGIAVPCTSCRYCVSHCRQELDIPGLLELYNEHCFTGGGFIAPMALSAVPQEKQPSACVGCGECETVCPQKIEISKVMVDFTDKLSS